MIVVKINVDGDRIIDVEAKGHSGYAKYGKDIVCSAVSAVVQTALLGLIDFSSGKVEYVLNNEEGYLKFSVPEPCSEKENIEQQAILKTMQLGLRDIERGYGAYLKTEVKQLCL